MSSKKKNKWKSLPSTCRTCIVGMIVLIVAGICLIVYGKISGIQESDKKTVNAEIIAIDLEDRDLSDSQRESLLENGADENSVFYDYKVVYSYTVDGNEYTHTDRELYEKGSKMRVGDTAVLNYAIVDGEIVINPVSDTGYAIFGIAFIVAGLLAGVMAFVLRPAKQKKRS